jgi:hypothetical protein
MNKSSRSGSLNSEFSVKVVSHSNGDDQLISALVKRISSKVVSIDFFSRVLTFFSCRLGTILLWINRISYKMRCCDKVHTLSNSCHGSESIELWRS